MDTFTKQLQAAFNQLGENIGVVLIGVLILLVILLIGWFVFNVITRYNDLAEISKGNEAAGMYMGSKLLGLSIIVAMASYSSMNWASMIVWSLLGIVLLSLIYLLIDFLLPKINVCKEIENGNKAMAQLLRAVIIGVSIVIGTFLL
jgi:putative membrane protein